MHCAAHFRLIVVRRRSVCWVKLEGEAYLNNMLSEIATCRLACAVKTMGMHLYVKSSKASDTPSSSFTKVMS